jgi:hypothetical protein
MMRDPKENLGCPSQIFLIEKLRPSYPMRAKRVHPVPATKGGSIPKRQNQHFRLSQDSLLPSKRLFGYNMNRLFITFFFLTVFPLSSRAEESAADISARIIKSSFTGIQVNGLTGTDPIPNLNEVKRLQNEATDHAFSDFQSYILSTDVPERIRIDYAIMILNKTKVHDEQYWHDRLLLGARLLELNKAEQGAAANP